MEGIMSDIELLCFFLKIEAMRERCETQNAQNLYKFDS